MRRRKISQSVWASWAGIALLATAGCSNSKTRTSSLTEAATGPAKMLKVATVRAVTRRGFVVGASHGEFSGRRIVGCSAARRRASDRDSGGRGSVRQRGPDPGQTRGPRRATSIASGAGFRAASRGQPATGGIAHRLERRAASSTPTMCRKCFRRRRPMIPRWRRPRCRKPTRSATTP